MDRELDLRRLAAARKHVGERLAGALDAGADRIITGADRDDHGVPAESGQLDAAQVKQRTLIDLYA